jgi:hypothetical protein
MSAAPLALVTGLTGQLGSAGAALGRAGFDVVTWDTTAATPPPLTGSTFDCYVQLPCDRGGAAQALVCRIDELAAVAGRLGPTASIVFAVDESDQTADPWSRSLAPDLLAAVALALLEDLGRSTASVAVLPIDDLCRAPQWEIPTPPLVSAP